MIKDKDFYIATKDERNDFIVYESNIYKLEEIDLINLIKICIVEKRNTGIGRKLLEAYRDATKHRADMSNQRLSQIGIQTQNGNKDPTRLFKSNTK